MKRKTRLPFPGIAYKTELGVGFNVPFYIALSPTYDLTLYGRYYTKQGFLGMAEWRQRFNNGQYNLRIAGINQEDPGGFHFGTVDAGTPDDPNKLRGMVGSKGDFEINPAGRSAGTSLASPTRISPTRMGFPAIPTMFSSRRSI